MCRVICVTAKPLCKGDFLAQIAKISKSEISNIILREKYLSEEEYLEFAKKVIEVCGRDKLIIHNFADTAKALGIKKVHLPFTAFKELKNRASFDVVGTSVHSVTDAVLAEKSGADYIIAGHIFETDCKKGIKGRGTEFLQSVCDSVKIPVYAIGGINSDTAGRLKEVNSKSFCGVCVMSQLMQSENPCDEVTKIIKGLR